MDRQRNPDYCFECGIYIGGKPEDHYCVVCEYELRDEKICRHCDRPLGGVEVSLLDTEGGVVALRLDGGLVPIGHALLISLEDTP